jgi:hypothetical protein
MMPQENQDSPLLRNSVKARQGKMVEFTRRVMSDKRGTMSAGHGNAGLVETMRMTADGLRLTAHGRGGRRGGVGH